MSTPRCRRCRVGQEGEDGPASHRRSYDGGWGDRDITCVRAWTSGPHRAAPGSSAARQGVGDAEPMSNGLTVRPGGHRPLPRHAGGSAAFRGRPWGLGGDARPVAVGCGRRRHPARPARTTLASRPATSKTNCCRPRSPVAPTHIPDRLRTAFTPLQHLDVGGVVRGGCETHEVPLP